MIKAIHQVCIAGGPYERGRQHGEAVSGQLKKFISDGVCRLNHLVPVPLELSGIRSRIADHRRLVELHAPQLAEEIEGLAVGACISSDEAWLLQLRREIIGYSSVTAGDCTTFASTRDDPLLAQTVDLNGNLDDFLSVLRVENSGKKSLVLSFGGLLGYLGINSCGLAIGINLVVGGTWGPGIPPYLAIRHLLDNCNGVASALELLQTLPLASSRAFTLCDSTTALCVEALDGEFRVLESQHLVHTNHYLHPDFIPRDELNIFAQNSSKRRYKEAMDFTADRRVTASECFELFSRPPICVKDNGDIRRERTVAAVVMEPALGRLSVRSGDPSLSETTVLSISE